MDLLHSWLAAAYNSLLREQSQVRNCQLCLALADLVVLDLIVHQAP